MRAVFATEAEAQKHLEACPAHTRIYPRTRESAPPTDTNGHTYEEYLARYKPRTLLDGSLSIPMRQSDWNDIYGEPRSESVLTESTLPLTAADICAEAARLVGGARATTHGDKALNFRNIAELWNGYWRIKCRLADERLTTPFTAHDVGCMMELFKIARRFSGEFNADDYIDAAGYAGCTGEIAARDAHTTTD
jgi:hypothetical protein